MSYINYLWYLNQAVGNPKGFTKDVVVFRNIAWSAMAPEMMNITAVLRK